MSFDKYWNKCNNVLEIYDINTIIYVHKYGDMKIEFKGHAGSLLQETMLRFACHYGMSDFLLPSSNMVKKSDEYTALWHKQSVIVTQIN